jgi:hypothetical protein
MNKKKCFRGVRGVDEGKAEPGAMNKKISVNIF